MSDQSLIETFESLTGSGDYRLAIADCIAIVRQHEAATHSMPIQSDCKLNASASQDVEVKGGESAVNALRTDCPHGSPAGPMGCVLCSFPIQQREPSVMGGAADEAPASGDDEVRLQRRTCPLPPNQGSKISVLDAANLLQPVLRSMLNEHGQMMQQRHTKGDEDFLISKAINDITPHLRTTEPVSVAAIEPDIQKYWFVHSKEVPGIIKAVLDAAGVPYVD